MLCFICYIPKKVVVTVIIPLITPTAGGSDANVIKFCLAMHVIKKNYHVITFILGRIILFMVVNTLKIYQPQILVSCYTLKTTISCKKEKEFGHIKSYDVFSTREKQQLATHTILYYLCMPQKIQSVVRMHSEYYCRCESLYFEPYDCCHQRQKMLLRLWIQNFKTHTLCSTPSVPK